MTSKRNSSGLLELTPHFLSAALLCTSFLPQTIAAQIGNPQVAGPQSFMESVPAVPGDVRAESSASNAPLSIPRGTILPVRLNSSLSSKTKPGQVITATIMQDVPLPNGDKIRQGSKVIGHILEPTPTSPFRTTISFRFDNLLVSKQTIPIITNLRAIAGFMEVLRAQTPPIGPGESDVFRWLDTVQIGGDVVYGDGGPVTRGDDPSDVVGKSVGNGVLGRITAKQGTKCRGPVDGNDIPQALWVFSSDACGVYGISHLEISHAGRTSPEGLIVLNSADGKLNLHSGAALLLRVNEAGQ